MSGFIDYAIGHSRLTIATLIFLLCAGLVSYVTIPKEAEPDVKELIRANADTLFTAHPGALAVARPKRITGRGFSVCVKAVVAGSMTGEPQPITLVAIIEHGKFTDRRRATAQDGCEGQSYEKVDVPRKG